jgi:molecular chaperone HtpG
MKDNLIPPELANKLDATTAPEVLRLSRAVGEILTDNKLPFFPNYTDHGARHITRLLDTIITKLIPEEVFSQLTAADAAVIACAALLHDLAMHLREDGFLQLISGKSAHKPLPWFDVKSGQRLADLPWVEEWIEFRSHIRRS